MPCYEFNYASNQPQLLPDVWVPCPSGDNCCIGLDTCMSNNICHDYGAMRPRDGSFSSYYNARCTDPTYTSPACDKICIGAPPDIVYNYTSKRWACCGRDSSGLVSCNSPIVGEYYEAPAPSNLTTLSAGAVFVSSATLTPDPVNHPTTYTFTTGSVSSSPSSAGLSSASSSSTLSTSSSSPTSTTSTPPPASPTPTSSAGLSTGAKAGIGVSVAIGVILATALAAFIILRQRRNRRQDPARQHIMEMANTTSHAQAYEKDTDPRPPVELYSPELHPAEQTNAFSYQDSNNFSSQPPLRSDAFSFQPSLRR